MSIYFIDPYKRVLADQRVLCFYGTPKIQDRINYQASIARFVKYLISI